MLKSAKSIKSAVTPKMAVALSLTEKTVSARKAVKVKAVSTTAPTRKAVPVKKAAHKPVKVIAEPKTLELKSAPVKKAAAKQAKATPGTKTAKSAKIVAAPKAVVEKAKVVAQPTLTRRAESHMQLTPLQRKALGVRLVSLREKMGLSQLQVSNGALGMAKSHAAVSRLERGTIDSVEIARLTKFATFFKTDIPALLQKQGSRAK